MFLDVRVFAIAPFLALMAACAPVQPSVNQTDPVREEIAILQKQLLELQVHQKETIIKLDASKAAIAALSSRLKSVEANTAAIASTQSELRSEASATPAKTEKKAVRNKKRVAKKATTNKSRRQE